LNNGVENVGSLQPEESLHEIEVGFADQPVFRHGAFPLGAFFGKDVTFETLLVRDLPRRRDFEAFFGAGVRFDLRHDTCFTVTL
jgi:hypothetical protein